MIGIPKPPKRTREPSRLKRTQMKRTTTPIANRRSKHAGGFWTRLSKACRERDAFCICGKGTVAAAHIHGVQRGRSRHDPNARCSVCLTWLNTLENLRGVCHDPECNSAVAEPCPGRGEDEMAGHGSRRTGGMR